MRFASPRIAAEWQGADLKGVRVVPALIGIVEDAADFVRSLYAWELMLTCLLRTPEENDALYVGRGYHPGTHLDGVHVRGRGGDARIRDVDPEAVRGLHGYLNERYIYDPERPTLSVALLEDGITAGSGAHLHLQVHPRTTNRHFTQEP
ncbi:MAG TPA: hypothetical protein PLB01_00025 [Thermoanaerobaculia bacterium]|nr:hypothetical protein [Thermoanaerobaculia bacterium]